MNSDDLIWEPGSSQLEEDRKAKRHRTPVHDLEGAVLKECVIFLRAVDQVVYIERRNTGTIAFVDGGRVSFGHTGAADLWCIVQIDRDTHAHVEIECKRRDGKGRLSPAQKEFQAFCASHDIPYFVVTSAEDLAKQLLDSGILS